MQLLTGVAPQDAIHVLAQLEVAPLCMGHTLCWEGDTADSVWLLQVRPLVIGCVRMVAWSCSAVHGPHAVLGGRHTADSVWLLQVGA